MEVVKSEIMSSEHFLFRVWATPAQYNNIVAVLVYST